MEEKGPSFVASTQLPPASLRVQGLLQRVLVLLLVFTGSFTAIWGGGKAGRLAYLILALAVPVVGAWDLLQLAILFLFMGWYWRIAPAWIGSIPVLPFLLPFLFSCVLVRLFPKVRHPLSWFRKGWIDPFAWGFTFLTGMASTAALIAWAFWTDHLGPALEFARELVGQPGWLLAGIVVPLFALANAFAEEAVYRGVLQEALQRTFRAPAVVLGLQALAFAAVHYAAGFPNGRVGFLMVYFYALALGGLRMRTRGVLAPYLAHVAADLTIGYFLLFRVLHG